MDESFEWQGSNTYIVSNKEKYKYFVEMMANVIQYRIELYVGFFESI